MKIEESGFGELVSRLGDSCRSYSKDFGYGSTRPLPKFSGTEDVFRLTYRLEYHKMPQWDFENFSALSEIFTRRYSQLFYEEKGS